MVRPHKLSLIITWLTPHEVVYPISWHLSLLPTCDYLTHFFNAELCLLILPSYDCLTVFNVAELYLVDTSQGCLADWLIFLLVAKMRLFDTFHCRRAMYDWCLLRLPSYEWSTNLNFSELCLVDTSQGYLVLTANSDNATLTR